MRSGSGAAGPFWCCVHAGCGDSCRVAGGALAGEAGLGVWGGTGGTCALARSPRSPQPARTAGWELRNRNAFSSPRPPLGACLGQWCKSLGSKPKTRENRPLQPKPGGVKTAVMKRTGSSAVGSRWLIIPKWEDRQVCLITCWAMAIYYLPVVRFDYRLVVSAVAPVRVQNSWKI